MTKNPECIKCVCVVRRVEIRGAARFVEIQICETHFAKITHFDTNSCLRTEDEGISELRDESCHISKPLLWRHSITLLLCITESG